MKALVYVAALAPDEGETVADVFYRTKPHPLAPKLAPDNHGPIYLPHEAFAAAFAQNASADKLALLSAVQRPLSPACITVPVNRPLWKDRPTWFLIAEQDRMIAPDTQRFMAERIARVRSHPVDHAPIVTAPGLVVDIIREAIREAISRPIRLRSICATSTFIKLGQTHVHYSGDGPMPDVDKYEILVLGSGEAGKWTAWTMADDGHRTAMVERKWLGGSCPNIACLPSKNVIYSARIASLARRGAEFGLEMDRLRINIAGIEQRKRKMVEAEHQFHAKRTADAGIELIMGEGRFVAPRTVEVALNEAALDGFPANVCSSTWGRTRPCPMFPGSCGESDDPCRGARPRSSATSSHSDWRRLYRARTCASGATVRIGCDRDRTRRAARRA